MFNLLTALSMRAHLRRHQKAGEPVICFFADGGSIPVRVAEVKLLSVVLDFLDEDEETWIGRYVFPLAFVLGLNESSVQRSRRRLMKEHDGVEMESTEVAVYEVQDDEDD